MVSIIIQMLDLSAYLFTPSSIRLTDCHAFLGQKARRDIKLPTNLHEPLKRLAGKIEILSLSRRLRAKITSITALRSKSGFAHGHASANNSRPLPIVGQKPKRTMTGVAESVAIAYLDERHNPHIRNSRTPFHAIKWCLNAIEKSLADYSASERAQWREYADDPKNFVDSPRWLPHDG